MIKESQGDVTLYKMAAWGGMAEKDGEFIDVAQGLSCGEVRCNESGGKQDVGRRPFAKEIGLAVNNLPAGNGDGSVLF